MKLPRLTSNEHADLVRMAALGSPPVDQGIIHEWRVLAGRRPSVRTKAVLIDLGTVNPSQEDCPVCLSVQGSRPSQARVVISVPSISSKTFFAAALSDADRTKVSQIANRGWVAFERSDYVPP